MEIRDFNRLVRAFYNAATGERTWRYVTEKIGDAFDAQDCVIVRQDNAASPILVLSCAAGQRGAVRPEYAQMFRRLREMARIEALPIDEAGLFTWHRFSAETETVIAGSGITGGGRVLVAATPFSGQGAIAAISLTRSYGQPAFAAEHQELLDFLLPHLRLAMEMQARVGMGPRSDWLRLNDIGAGTLVVDSGRMVHFQSETARAELATGAGLAVRHGRLYATDKATDLHLAEAIGNATGQAVGADAGPVTMLRVGDGTILSVIPYAEQGADKSANGALCLIVIKGLTESSAIVRRYLARQYDLTPAEARLAEALVQGERLQAFADRVGVTVNTVKSQLQHIFQKSGHARQSDFIRDALGHLLLATKLAPSQVDDGEAEEPHPARIAELRLAAATRTLPPRPALPDPTSRDRLRRWGN